MTRKKKPLIIGGSSVPKNNDWRDHREESKKEYRDHNPETEEYEEEAK